MPLKAILGDLEQKKLKSVLQLFLLWKLTMSIPMVQTVKKFTLFRRK